MDSAYTMEYERLDKHGPRFAVCLTPNTDLEPVSFILDSFDGFRFHAWLSPDAAEYLAAALTRAATLARENAQVAAS